MSECDKWNIKFTKTDFQMSKKFIDLILENALNIESRKKYAFDREGFKLKDQYLVDLKLIA